MSLRRIKLALCQAPLRDYPRKEPLVVTSIKFYSNSFTNLLIMAFGIGTSFNAGEGDEEYTGESTQGENSSDMSSDSEAGEVIRALEPNVSRSGKRTYGVPVKDMLTERRHKNAKLDEQLAILRSILPSSRENNPPSQGKGAFPPNAQAGGQTTDMGSTNHVLYEHPQVEVKRVNGRLELRIACVNRPGLLIDILAALDSKRINVMQGSIMCCENVFFRAFSLEKETMVLHAGPECLPLEAEEEAVKELIFRAIRQGIPENDSK